MRQTSPATALIAVIAAALALAAIACGGSPEPDATIDVELNEFKVIPSASEVAAGRIRFVARNTGGAVHELAVVSVDANGNKREVADVEDVGPGKAKQFTTTLKAGHYELACLIAPGQSGSVLDHYQQGMHTAFTVR